MKKFNEYINNTNTIPLNDIINRGLSVTAIAHGMHLATQYYSKHKAIELFYTEIQPLIDKLAECSIGLYGNFYKNQLYATTTKEFTFPELVLDYKSRIDNLRDIYDDAILSIFDEITVLCLRSVYLYNLD